MAQSTGWRALFLNHIGQIKWQWRALAFVFVLMITSIVIETVLVLVVPPGSDSALTHDWNLSVQYSARALSALLVTGLLLRVLDRRQWGSVGIHPHSTWFKQLAFGVGLGSVIAVVIALGVYLAGGLQIEVRAAAFFPALVNLAVGTLLWLGMTFFYEIVFRGYLLQTISEGLGKIGGTIVLGFLCASFQSNFGATGLLSGVVGFLTSILLSVAYFRTASLWAPIGIHFSWNFVQGFLVGAPVKGSVIYGSLFKATLTGPSWISGHVFGPDGGLVGAVVTGVALYYVSQSRHLSISEDMRRLKYKALTTPFVRVSKGETKE